MIPRRLALAAVLALPTQGSEPLSEERVRAAFEDARAALAAEPGFALPPDTKLVFTDAETIGARVEAENLPLVQLRESDPEKARATAHQLGETFARFAFAKYSWHARAHGRLPISGEAIEDEELVELAAKLFDAVRRIESAPAPR